MFSVLGLTLCGMPWHFVNILHISWGFMSFCTMPDIIICILTCAFCMILNRTEGSEETSVKSGRNYNFISLTFITCPKHTKTVVFILIKFTFLIAVIFWIYMIWTFSYINCVTFVLVLLPWFWATVLYEIKMMMIHIVAHMLSVFAVTLW